MEDHENCEFGCHARGRYLLYVLDQQTIGGSGMLKTLIRQLQKDECNVMTEVLSAVRPKERVFRFFFFSRLISKKCMDYCGSLDIRDK